MTTDDLNVLLTLLCGGAGVGILLLGADLVASYVKGRG